MSNDYHNGTHEVSRTGVATFGSSSLVSSLSRYHYYERELKALRAHAQEQLRQYEDSLALPSSRDGSLLCTEGRDGRPFSLATIATPGERQANADTVPSTSVNSSTSNPTDFRCCAQWWCNERTTPRDSKTAAPSTQTPRRKVSTPPHCCVEPLFAVLTGDTSTNSEGCERCFHRLGHWSESAIDEGALPSYEKRFLRRLEVWERQGSTRRGARLANVTEPVKRLSRDRGGGGSNAHSASPIRELTPVSQQRRRFCSPSLRKTREKQVSRLWQRRGHASSDSDYSKEDNLATNFQCQIVEEPQSSSNSDYVCHARAMLRRSSLQRQGNQEPHNGNSSDLEKHRHSIGEAKDSLLSLIRDALVRQ